jgi:hypothetical protein
LVAAVKLPVALQVALQLVRRVLLVLEPWVLLAKAVLQVKLALQHAG